MNMAEMTRKHIEELEAELTALRQLLDERERKITALESTVDLLRARNAALQKPTGASPVLYAM